MELEGYSELIEITKGGMATVYKAEQLSLNRTVAIKFLSAELLWDKEAKHLFDQESLVIAQLDHPNIIHIIDRGLTAKRRPYFVMQHIHGKDLAQLLKQQTLTLDEKLKLLLQICKGMAFAHKNGVIHRDIKPANILLDKEQHVTILDFGIAWLAASGHPENIVGTPDYMSPEQFKAPASVTHSSDIYSLGVVMYELFMGELPTAYFNDLIGSMKNLPPALAELIAQCLQTETTKRPASADEIELRLLKIMQGTHITKSLHTEADKVMSNIKDKFSLLDVIKHNDYGTVYLFEDRTTHSLLVIKKRINTEAGYQQAQKLKQVLHPNIIKILGTSRNESTFIIVMEHLSEGNLQDRLVRPYTLKKFLPIATQICKGMFHAHSHKILHANLRPSNILFDEKGNIKLTDFGLDEHYTLSASNSSWYQPTELASASIKRDIYSAGAIFYHMLTGMPVIIDNAKIKRDDAFERLNKPTQNLIRKMLEQEPNDHYTSFKHVLDDLKNIPLKQSNNARNSFSLKKLLLFILLINAISLGIIALFKPGLFSSAVSAILKLFF